MSKHATYDEVKNDFRKIGLELLSDKFVRGKNYLDCRCMTHHDNVFKITYENVKDKIKNNKSGCVICQKESKPIITYTDEEYNNIVSNINPHITLLSKYNENKNDVRYICNNHTDFIYKGRVNKNTLLKPFQCPICKNGHEKIVIGKTDIKSTNPILFECLLDKTQNEKFNIHSYALVNIRCPSCGNILKNKSISQVIQRGFKCKCMDGNSQGEKFFFSIISQVDNNIDVEYRLSNNRLYRYDFHGCVDGRNWIVEIMGKQHSVKSFETCGGRTLEEEIQNDKNKMKYALSNGIDYYICIDSHNSGFNELREAILNSDISNIYDLSFVDWDTAYLNSLKSDVIKVCEYWNNGYKVMEICSLLNIRKNTVRRYLSKGNELGICQYDHTKNNRTSVICINTGEIFKSQREAERKYNLHRGYLYDYLTNKRKMIINGVEYEWKYYE